MNNYIFIMLSLSLLVAGCTAQKAALKDNKGDTQISPQDHQQALDLFKQGSELLYINNADALSKFKSALRHDPKLIPAYYNAGVALEALDQDSEAKDYYERCLAVDKEQAGCLENLVLLQYKLGQEQEAFKLLESLEPARSNVAQAKLFFLKKDYAQAEKYARAAIELEAENIEALYVMARIFYEQKSYAAAKWVAKNALELAPSHGGLYLLLGHINDKLDLTHDALDAYALAHKYLPQEEALESYGLLLLRRGRVNEALEILKKLGQQKPDTFRHQLHVGNAYAASKQFAPAYAAYLQAKKLEPANLDVDFNLGLLFLDMQPDAMSELERYKTSQAYFKAYLEKPNLGAERLKEVEAYLKNLGRKIEIAESAAQPVREEEEPEVEPDKE
jgi:tetratricopeptide (TPR) repeat protein